jgi:6,7-dimethyl-8-ribityllumazine synthase
MSGSDKNLSSVRGSVVPNARQYRFGIVYAEWNLEITSSMVEGAKQILIENGALVENITIRSVPGSFELTLGAQYMAEHADAVICLGCLIQGETPHFNFISSAVADGITTLNLKYNKPFVFGVLTTNTLGQALARSGGDMGNKGEEAAITAIKMLDLKRGL